MKHSWNASSAATWLSRGSSLKLTALIIREFSQDDPVGTGIR